MGVAEDEELLGSFRLNTERALRAVAGKIEAVARGGAPPATLGELAYEFNFFRGGAMTLGLDALAELSGLAEELALKLAFPAGEEHLGRGIDILANMAASLEHLVSAEGHSEEQVDARVSSEARALLDELGGPRESFNQDFIDELLRELQDD